MFVYGVCMIAIKKGCVCLCVVCVHVWGMCVYGVCMIAINKRVCVYVCLQGGLLITS